MKLMALAAVLLARATAQDPLTIQDAARMALERHPAVEATSAQIRVAEARIKQANGGYLPRVNYTESWTRSDNPVFVFSSLLTQHQFTVENFDISRLNRPDFLNNFQSLVTVEQTVFDWGGTKAQVKSAELGRAMSQQQDRRARMDLIARVIRTYYGAALADANLAAAEQALRSAQADAERAATIREAGMSTDADVLSIRVHLASIREQEVRRSYERRVALAALNEALGFPMQTEHRLATPLSPVRLSAELPAAYSKSAEQNRPELKQTELAARMAEQQTAAARSARKPQFGLQGAFEADRQEFIRKGGANWTIAASMRWNVFNGFVSGARIAEAEAVTQSARAQQKAALRAVELDVFRAWSEFRAAEERISVTEAVVAEAEESLRIVKNRFENGLTTVTELLRAESALLDARTRRIAAVHDQRIAAAQLDFVTGTLSVDSESLR
jgi:outer membrane protein TolC